MRSEREVRETIRDLKDREKQGNVKLEAYEQEYICGFQDALSWVLGEKEYPEQLGLCVGVDSELPKFGDQK